MGWIDTGVRLAVGVVLGVLALPWCIDGFVDTIRHHRHLPQDPWTVLLGLLLGLVLVLFRRPNRLLHTALHEACHALACLLLRVRIRRVEFSADQGGAVEFERTDPIRATLIAIAPYTLPIVLAPVLVARMWVHAPGPARMALSGLAMFLFVTHLSGLARNLRDNFWGAEGDLARVGRLLGLVLVCAALLLVSVWLIRVLWER